MNLRSFSQDLMALYQEMGEEFANTLKTLWSSLPHWLWVLL